MKKLFRKPPREIPQLTEKAQVYLNKLTTGNEELRGRIRIFGAELVRGTCRARTNKKGTKYYQITIPAFAFHDPNTEFLEYYIIHEMCHVLQFEDTGKMDHGPSFYKEFKVLCPEHLWKYETDYKPRNAVAAGLKI